MAKDFQKQEIVANYDQHIRKLIPGYELVHQQIDAILSTYIAQSAQIMIVGCGTGYELSYLLDQHPYWHFTAVDSSKNMLEQARQNLTLQQQQRVKLVHAEMSQFKAEEKFDAVIAILIGHFIANPEKAEFYQSIYQQMNAAAILLTYDLMQVDQQCQLQILQSLAEKTGLKKYQSEKMIQRLAQDFHLISVASLQQLFSQIGFKTCKSYCQIMNYYGFILEK